MRRMAGVVSKAAVSAASDESRRRPDGFEPAREARRVEVADEGGILNGACGGEGERLERDESELGELGRSDVRTKEGTGRGLEEGGCARSNVIKD